MSRSAQLISRIENRGAALAIFVAILATVASAAVTLMAGEAAKSLDETEFLDIARSLAFDGAFANADGELTAYRAPGLVLFMAPLVRLGGGLLELRLELAALFGLTLVMLYSLFRRHGGPLAGLAAVVMVPLWPVGLYASTTVYPQTLAAFLLVGSVSLLDMLRGTSSLWVAGLAGIFLGALILTVPMALLLFPIFLVWVGLRGSRRLAQCLVVCLVSGLMVSAWTYRNYLAFDAFVPVASSSGYNLLVGNAPAARGNTGSDVPFPDHVYTALTGKSEVEQNQVLTDAAVAEITADPARFARLYAAKFLNWFAASNTLVSDRVDELEHGASRIDVGLRELVLVASYGLIIVVPLVLRLMMVRRMPLKDIEILSLCLWIGAGLVYALFFTRVRFRLPFDWLIIGMNGMFLATLLRDRLFGPGTPQPGTDSETVTGPA